MHVDAFMAIDTSAFYIRGWAKSAEPSARIRLRAPEGASAELGASTYRFPRADVEQFFGTAASDVRHSRAGFVSFITPSVPSSRAEGWLMELATPTGGNCQTTVPSAIRDPKLIRDSILRDLTHDIGPGDSLMRSTISPALLRIQQRIHDTATCDRVDQYGTPVSSPRQSVVIPLYGRIDFLEHQLAQFVHDPSMRETDLIYVLDSPEDAESLERSATQLARLYPVPFRVVTMRSNVGFSGANNMGAQFARARLLVLMNSDVLPDRPGWLKQMAEFYETKELIGALGPKLLYEDDSLQHAGLYFYRPLGAKQWENLHYYKGLHRVFPAANMRRPVPAVTAACLMISSNLYHKVGGLRGMYVQGDYEDSDLCLRLIELGRENWYLPDVELYHLEGQSYPIELRQLTSKYNTWLHSHLWNETIERVMATYADPMRNG
jgi:O-antigen biosynthesis protein